MNSPKIGEWLRFNLVSYLGTKLVRYSKVYSVRVCDHHPNYTCYDIRKCSKCPGYFINNYAAYKAHKLMGKEKQAIALYLIANKGDTKSIEGSCLNV